MKTSAAEYLLRMMLKNDKGGAATQVKIPLRTIEI
jgi:hypothetical protein